MLKKVLAGIGIAATFTGMFLLGSFALGPVFAQMQYNNSSTQVVAQSTDNGSAKVSVQDLNEAEEQVGDQNQVDEQQSQYTGSILVNSSQYQNMSEAEEATALQSQATITSVQAEEAALVANPGNTVIKTELDNENGVLVYSVELSNGLDVKVDAGNGKILHTEQAGNDAAEAENTEGQEAVED
jgi:uncharacterized membrane protein YkoI